MHADFFHAFQAPPHSNSLPPGLFPSTKGCRPPLMDFRTAYVLGAGRKYKGRPMVWETHKIHKEVNHIWFTSSSLPLCQLLTLKCIRTCTGHLSTPHTFYITTSLKPTPVNVSPGQCKNKIRPKHSHLTPHSCVHWQGLHLAGNGSFEPCFVVWPCIRSTDPMFYIVSTLFFHPPLSLCTMASCRWIRPCSCLFLLLMSFYN